MPLQSFASALRVPRWPDEQPAGASVVVGDEPGAGKPRSHGCGFKVGPARIDGYVASDVAAFPNGCREVRRGLMPACATAAAASA